MATDSRWATDGPDEVRWFDSFGTCTSCSKPAAGVLRGPRNDSYGPYCRAHAEKRLAAAKQERAQFDAYWAKQNPPPSPPQ